MKKLAMCLMMLSLGLFSVGCGEKADDAAPAAAPAPPAGGIDGPPHDAAPGEAGHADDAAPADAPAEN